MNLEKQERQNSHIKKEPAEAYLKILKETLPVESLKNLVLRERKMVMFLSHLFIQTF